MNLLVSHREVRFRTARVLASVWRFLMFVWKGSVIDRLMAPAPFAAIRNAATMELPSGRTPTADLDRDHRQWS